MSTALGAGTRSTAIRAGRTPRTAFVLSGGASLGALQVGMLGALYERGVVPDLLVATSVGALNAAFVASRPQTEATAKELARAWRGLDREDIFPVSMAALVGGLSGRRDHMVPDRALRRLIGRYVQFEDIAEAAVPLHVVAFDLNSGREVLLSEGPAIDAVAASASIPGVFPPVRTAGRLLIDGGVVNNTPISRAVELGAETIYVLPTQERRRTQARAPKSALDVAIHGLSTLIDGRLEADLAGYSADAELIVLPARNHSSVQPTDFDHTSRLIGEALTDARTFLARADASPPLVGCTVDPIAA